MTENRAVTPEELNTFSEKESAIVGLACAIGAGSHSSLADHFAAAREAGVTEAELNAIISKAMCVKNSARDATNQQAYKALGITLDLSDCCKDEEVTLLKEMAAIASAVGTNCLANYRKHTEIGSSAGLSDEAIRQITAQAFNVKADLMEDFQYLVEHPTEAMFRENDECCEDSGSDEPCCSPGSEGGCC